MLPLILLAATVAVANSEPLPSGWTVCHLSDPRQQDCLKNAIQIAHNDLVPGKPILDNLPLDPLVLREIKLSQRLNLIHLNMTLKDAEMTGLKQMEILRVKGRLPEVTVEAFVPRVQMSGTYIMNSKLLGIPANSDGSVDFSQENVKGNATIKFSEKMLHGKKHYEIRDIAIKWDGENPEVNLEARSNVGIAAMVNHNSKVLAEQFKPTFEKAVGNVFMSLANRILAKLSKDVLTPP